MTETCSHKYLTPKLLLQFGKTTFPIFTFVWPCIVKNFSIIKPTRCTNFTNFILAWNSTCFGQFACPSSGVCSLYTQQWYMSYRFVDSFRAGPAWSSSKAVYKPVWHIPLLNVQWINSWWWTEKLSEICRISCQNKICEISASSWFYYKEIYYDARSHERKIRDSFHSGVGDFPMSQSVEAFCATKSASYPLGTLSSKV